MRKTIFIVHTLTFGLNTDPVEVPCELLGHVGLASGRQPHHHYDVWDVDIVGTLSCSRQGENVSENLWFIYLLFYFIATYCFFLNHVYLSSFFIYFISIQFCFIIYLFFYANFITVSMKLGIYNYSFGFRGRCFFLPVPLMSKDSIHLTLVHCSQGLTLKQSPTTPKTCDLLTLQHSFSLKSCTYWYTI